VYTIIFANKIEVSGSRYIIDVYIGIATGSDANTSSLHQGLGCSVKHSRKGREREGIPGGYSSPAKGPTRKTRPNRAAARPIVAARSPGKEDREERREIKERDWDER
jgi:hypothetical protein